MYIDPNIIYEYYFDMDGTLNDFQFGAPEEILFIPGYFENRPEKENMIDAVKRLYLMQTLGFPLKLYIISKYLKKNKTAATEKHSWLDRLLPEIPRKNRILLTTEENKENYVNVSHRTVLIDDYGENLKQWKRMGGRIIKVATDAKDRREESKQWPACISHEQNSSEIVDIILAYQKYEMLYGHNI